MTTTYYDVIKPFIIADGGQLYPSTSLLYGPYASSGEAHETICTLVQGRVIPKGLRFGVANNGEYDEYAYSQNSTSENGLENIVKLTCKCEPFQLTDGIIKTNHLANGAVTNAKIADTAVSTSKIANAAVSTTKLANSAVTTEKIMDKSVTYPKMAEWFIYDQENHTLTLTINGVSNTYKLSQVSDVIVEYSDIRARFINSYVGKAPSKGGNVITLSLEYEQLKTITDGTNTDVQQLNSGARIVFSSDSEWINVNQFGSVSLETNTGAAVRTGKVFATISMNGKETVIESTFEQNGVTYTYGNIDVTATANPTSVESAGGTSKINVTYSQEISDSNDGMLIKKDGAEIEITTTFEGASVGANGVVTLPANLTNENKIVPFNVTVSLNGKSTTKTVNITLKGMAVVEEPAKVYYGVDTTKFTEDTISGINFETAKSVEAADGLVVINSCKQSEGIKTMWFAIPEGYYVDMDNEDIPAITDTNLGADSRSDFLREGPVEVVYDGVVYTVYFRTVIMPMSGGRKVTISKA